MESDAFMVCSQCSGETDQGAYCPHCGSQLTDNEAVSWINVAPPLIMVIGSITSVLWVDVGFPVVVGALAYPLVFSCVLLVIGAISSFRKTGNVFLLSWGALILASIYQLIAKIFASTDGSGMTSDVVNFAAFAGFFVAMVVAVGIGRIDARRSALFVGLYFAWAVTGPSISAASAGVTVTISAIALGESITLAWAIHAYGKRNLDQALIAVIGLLAIHHLLVGWHPTVAVEGEFTWAQHFIDSLVQGPVFVIFVNAILIVFIMLLRKLTRTS